MFPKKNKSKKFWWVIDLDLDQMEAEADSYNEVKPKAGDCQEVSINKSVMDAATGADGDTGSLLLLRTNSSR